MTESGDSLSIYREENIMSVTIKYVEIDVTDACNMACKHCYKSKKKKNEYLSPDLIIDFLNMLGEKQEISNIVISGGEPLLYPEITYLLRYLNGKYNIRLNSNGVLIHEHIDLFRSLEKFKLQISLDGYDRKSYFEMRQLDVFQRVLSNAMLCKNNGINVDFRTTLGRDNINDYHKFIEISNSCGIPIKFKPVVGLDNVESECVSIPELKIWYKELEKKNLEKYAEGNLFNAKYSCPLIKDNPVISALYIDEMGDIHPCLGLLGHQFKVGNIYDINYSKLEKNIYDKRDFIRELLELPLCKSCSTRKNIGDGTCVAACYYGERECINKVIGEIR